MKTPLSSAGRAAVAGSLLVLVWSVPGLIVNPDFATGDAATAERVLGVDMNGWHAVSGFLVALPGLLVARRADAAALFDVAAAGSLIATGVWALLDSQAAFGLFSFPHGGADALLHFATSTVFLAGAAHWYVTGRQSAAGGVYN